MIEITELGWRGLKRYRDERLALLGELGAAKCDLAASRFGPIRLYVVGNAELAQEALLDRAADYTKSRALSRFARPLLGDGLLSAAGAVHKRHRKLLAPGFQARRISRYATDMVELARAMLAGWRPGEDRDFAHELMGLTIRIAAKTMFGDADVPVDEIGEALDVANRWVMTEASSLIPIPLAVPTPRNRAMRRALARLDDSVYALIARKRASGSDGDILSMLLAAQDDDGQGGLSDREVRDEVMTFFMAGHETTATALSWMFHALVQTPPVLRALTAELDAVLGDRAPTFDDVDQLPYTRAVVNETLRLYPPAYMLGRQASVDTELGGHSIRAGSYILVNTFGIHRRGDYHPEPLAFRPERFADSDTGGAPRGGYIPFGLGPRVCIGNQFAAMEACLLAAVIFGRLAPAGTSSEVVLDPLITLRPSPGLPFQVAWR